MFNSTDLECGLTLPLGNEHLSKYTLFEVHSNSKVGKPIRDDWPARNRLIFDKQNDRMQHQRSYSHFVDVVFVQEIAPVVQVTSNMFCPAALLRIEWQVNRYLMNLPPRGRETG